MASAQFFAFENLTVSTSSVGFTAATYGNANFAHVYIDVADVRMRLDGGAPTASVGVPLAVGSEVILENKDELTRVRFIRDGGTDAVLQTNFGVK